MDSRRNQNLRTGDILMEFGYINEEQLAQAVAYKQEHKEARIGGALILITPWSTWKMYPLIPRR